jgi:GTPase SAR1 family protein
MANIELKVVLLGKECCGKTSLAERFLTDRFAGENRYQNTIGAAFGAKVGAH